MTLMMLMSIMIMIKFIILKWNKFNNLKNFFNTLESGFNNMNNFKINFSMNFTYIMIIFILFDIELMILIPLMILQKMMKKYFFSMIMFMMFMFLTTMIEMKNNKINWMV